MKSLQEVPIRKPRREAAEGPGPAGTRTWDCQPAEL